MDDVLLKLGTFAGSKDTRLACAAAVVLAELAPRDPAIAEKLAASLHVDDPVRRPFIIEALGRMGTPEAAEILIPCLKAAGPAREEALRAIAHTSGAALRPLLKLLNSAAPDLIEKLVEAAARTGETAAFHGLFAALNGADVERCRAIRAGLRAAMTAFPERHKEHLCSQLEKAFNDDRLTAHEPALIALLKIAGDLGAPSLQKAMLARTKPSHPPAVRQSALFALGRLHLTGEKRGELASLLLPLLSDPDLVHVAEPAQEALRQAQLSGEHAAALRKLVQSPSPRIREFAMQAAARLGHARSIHELTQCLEHPDHQVREEALAALAHSPAAAPALAERLAKAESAQAAQDTARVLARLSSHLSDKQFDTLAECALALSQQPAAAPDSEEARLREAKWRGILNVFRASTSEALLNAVFKLARSLRGKGEFARAHELLKSAGGLPGWNEKRRVELALAGLSYGMLDLSRAVRASDSHLQLLESALDAGGKPDDLAEQIARDPALNRKAQYYIGFHFVERMNAARELGRRVLELLSESRSDEGRQAREKLILEGLLQQTRAGRAGILEQRAKVMLAPKDTAEPEARVAKKAKTPAGKSKKKVSAKPASMKKLPKLRRKA